MRIRIYITGAMSTVRQDRHEFTPQKNTDPDIKQRATHERSGIVLSNRFIEKPKQAYETGTRTCAYRIVWTGFWPRQHIDDSSRSTSTAGQTSPQTRGAAPFPSSGSLRYRAIWTEDKIWRRHLYSSLAVLWWYSTFFFCSLSFICRTS